MWQNFETMKALKKTILHQLAILAALAFFSFSPTNSSLFAKTAISNVISNPLSVYKVVTPEYVNGGLYAAAKKLVGEAMALVVSVNKVVGTKSNKKQFGKLTETSKKLFNEFTEETAEKDIKQLLKNFATQFSAYKDRVEISPEKRLLIDHLRTLRYEVWKLQ